jgi:5-formyltetrahydrofolate cyclo-ligase
VVAAYWPVGSEVDVRPALRELLARGCRLTLPWVDGPSLQLAAVDALEDLVPGWRGVLEPGPERRRPVPLSTVDVVVVPGLAFDERGHRLGSGGGHYDRLLADRGPGTAVVAVAYAEQVVPAVPVEAHDAPVDAIVTDRAILHP